MKPDSAGLTAVRPNLKDALRGAGGPVRPVAAPPAVLRLGERADAHGMQQNGDNRAR